MKENVLNWFEPRSVSQAAAGQSEIKAKYNLDNNFVVPATWKKADGTTNGAAIGAGTSVYNRAIDRVVTDSHMTASGAVTLIFTAPRASTRNQSLAPAHDPFCTRENVSLRRGAASTLRFTPDTFRCPCRTTIRSAVWPTRSLAA